MDTHQIVFMGSADFSVPCLQALADNFSIVGVVTQPDRRAGRGRKLTPPPTKILAQKLGIPTIQPEMLRTNKVAKLQIQSWNPTIIVVVAYGQILKSDVLEIAPFGCINVHASLLPRWRGVSPIQAAILNGDEATGVSIMKMDEGVDTGPILSKRDIPIASNDTGGSLNEKLSYLGAELLIETIPKYILGNIIPVEQGDSPTPYAPMLFKTDGELNFSQPSSYLARKVRAFYPWPGTFTLWKGKPLKILSADPLKGESPGVGKLLTQDGFPAIGTSDGLLVIRHLQPPGKKPMYGDDFLRGAKDWV